MPDGTILKPAFPDNAEQPPLEHGLKAGVKTTEFWLSLASLLIGLGLVVFGHTEIQQQVGGAMLSLTAPGYAIARGLVKKGK